MNSYELKKLRGLVEKEKERRKKVNKLQDFEAVKEYLALVGLEPEKLDDSDRAILRAVLKNFEVKHTNGIYVCTSAMYKESEIIYQDTLYHDVEVSVDSPLAEFKEYKDIESGDYLQRKAMKANDAETIEEFEKEHIVLNTSNVGKYLSGYLVARLDFFESTLLYGQEKSKKLLLDKYKRL